jgi:hypothetical protein
LNRIKQQGSEEEIQVPKYFLSIKAGEILSQRKKMKEIQDPE